MIAKNFNLLKTNINNSKINSFIYKIKIFIIK